MWIADGWKDYEVIDCSGGEKLERWGKYILVRPDPQVIWDTDKKAPQWRKMNGHYHRSSKGGGEWEFFSLPEQWSINYKGLTFQLKPFSFKHTGLFPEQAANWDWFGEKIKNAGRPVKVLNLFAYTGGATLAAAKAGASVTHVDASKGMVAWAKENAKSSGLEDAPIRWIVDDCVKFVEREIRRGNLEDRGRNLPVSKAVCKAPLRQSVILPDQLLHNRTCSGRSDLYARNSRCSAVRRNCKLRGDRTSGYKFQTRTPVRRFRTLGSVIN